MPIINGVPIVDPFVIYHGEIIPPKPPLADPPVTDTTINYAGKQLSSIPAKSTPIPVNAANNPSYIVIGVNINNGLQLAPVGVLNGLQLPLDTVIMINGKKILAESQIIDGVSVFEHISRKPYQIDFDFVIRPEGTISGVGQPGTYYPFPQISMNNLWTLWQQNTVQTVQNTYLNGLGISSIIIESIVPATVRGSLNVPVKIKCFENQLGQTIIM